MAPLHVNFSSEEASSEAQEFTPIPSGTYYARVTDIETKECGENSKNPGKPYWHIEFTVQEGEYNGRKLWTNAMLFEGALYTTAQLLRATGFAKSLQTGEIPDEEQLISKEVDLVVKKLRDKYREEQDGDGVAQWKNEVKGIKPHGEVQVASAKKGKGSLLP